MSDARVLCANCGLLIERKPPVREGDNGWRHVSTGFARCLAADEVPEGATADPGEPQAVTLDRAAFRGVVTAAVWDNLTAQPRLKYRWDRRTTDPDGETEVAGFVHRMALGAAVAEQIMGVLEARGLIEPPSDWSEL